MLHEGVEKPMSDRDDPRRRGGTFRPPILQREVANEII